MNKKRITLNSLQPKFFNHGGAIRLALERVISSGWVILGPELRRFEASFASYLNARGCVGVANGTDAIELALRAIGINSGDKVATVANAGMYTTTALLAIGAQPIFMDVNEDNYCVTLSEVMRVIESEKVKAVVVTHLFGNAVPEIYDIALFCKQSQVALIEDCAQAHGAKIQGQYVGTFGNAASFSFYPTKNLGSIGDGGAVVSNDEEILRRLELLRQYGWSEKYIVSLYGARNSRLDEIQAAVLSELLPYLESMNKRRREIANKYCNEITNPAVTLPSVNGESFVAHLFVIRVKNRNLLRAHLNNCNVASEIHYPLPDHRQPLFGLCFSKLSLNTTERLADEILTLPCYPEMLDSDIASVVAAVNSWTS